jgi:hypothetical protein
MAKALAKAIIRQTPEELELQSVITQYGAERVLKVWQSRMDQLTRQRSAEYRARQAEKQRERKLADKQRIEALEAELARTRGVEATESNDEEHAA